MKEDIQQYEKKIIQLRKQFAELEMRRLQYQSDIPEEIWQELTDVSYRLDQAEQKVTHFYCEVIADLNHSRGQIIVSLEEFIHLQEKIRNIEDQFLLNIVGPGYKLKKSHATARVSRGRIS
jgi:Cdc6-like AAA superfamily ATPase